jgi:hypothetical protein
MIAEMTLVRMCDESLDASVDALLSRISKLEYAVSVASISSSPIISSGTPAAQSATPETSVTDTKQKSEKAPSAAAENSQDPVKNITDTRKTSDKPSLRPIRSKMEIAEKLALTDIPASSFLKSSYIFEDQDSRIIIKLTSEFAITMLSRPQTKSALSKALSACLMRDINESMISIEIGSDADAKKYDVLDELMED